MPLWTTVYRILRGHRVSLSEAHTWERNCWVMWSLHASLLEVLSPQFPPRLHHLPFPPATSGGSSFPRLCQHSFLPICFITAIPEGRKQPLVVVLICISLMTYNVMPLFVCLLAVCICSLRNSYSAFCSFLSWVICLSVEGLVKTCLMMPPIPPPR